MTYSLLAAAVLTVMSFLSLRWALQLRDVEEWVSATVYGVLAIGFWTVEVTSWISERP